MTTAGVRVAAFGDTYPHREQLRGDFGLSWDGRAREWSGVLAEDRARAFAAWCAERKVGHRVGDGPRHTYLPPGRASRGATVGVGAVHERGWDLDGLDGGRPRRPGRPAGKGGARRR
jgi:hypothetical protein